MACTMAMTASNVYSPDLISFNTNERKKSHVNTFKLLVTEDVLNYNGQIILFRAALHGALEVLQYLLEEHSTTFDVNQIFKIQVITKFQSNVIRYLIVRM